ncbi:MAG: GGDEF and EAL domain-containing protein [Acidobacteriota bacterium]|nr:GGDEF and EAL domain-containing protein [Acidobacteriota bacterium]
MIETAQPGITFERVLPPSVLLAALENPDSGLLIFDAGLHVLHASGAVWSLLQIHLEPSRSEPDVLQLLSWSALDVPSAVTAKAEIREFAAGEDKAKTIFLRNLDGSLFLRLRLRRLTLEHLAASFDVWADPPAGSEFNSRDPLTGLATRSNFENALQQALQGLPRIPVSVLLVNLDRFKAVNDTLGHAAGDSLLLLVSERLKASVRSTDVAARFGGDEFAVLIVPSSSEDVPASIARRILDLVQRTYLIEGQLVNIGTSIGISQSFGEEVDGKDLLRDADLALYQSKQAGRGTFHFFESSMADRAKERRTNELELRKALALRQLEVFYQPQVDAAGRRLIGFEALLRWRHPVRGLLAPGMFLQIAEEIGVIVPIGEWVVRTACREAMKWPGEVSIAVNASPLEFNSGRFAESVRRALQASGLPGERLEIEITEGILLRDNESIHKTLHALRAMKVRIAMDDFGTGYASLSQLAKFPFDKIKIDRSLAGFEGDDKKQRAIVRAITALGQSLGVCTLAEGVENPEQMARLQSDGCTSVQGYLFGRPMPAGDLDEVISRLCPQRESDSPKAAG